MAESRGLEIVETKYSQFGGRGLLRVFIAKPGGISVNDCFGLSRELEVLLEAEGVIEEPYTLEVSSPGLDRPLKSRKDFARNTGNRLKVEYQTPAGKITTLAGKLEKLPDLAVQIGELETSPRRPPGALALGAGIPLALIILEY